MTIQRAFTGTQWEQKVGYCRAVRVDRMIFVTGTASVEADGTVHAPGDAYAQAVRCFEIIQNTLHELGAELRHVVRTRMFVTDIARWSEFGRAHREFLGDHPPATSMIEIKALINPDMLIEIEADAVVAPTD